MLGGEKRTYENQVLTLLSHGFQVTLELFLTLQALI